MFVALPTGSLLFNPTKTTKITPFRRYQSSIRVLVWGSLKKVTTPRTTLNSQKRMHTSSKLFGRVFAMMKLVRH